MRQRRGRASTAAALAVVLALAAPLAATARGWEGDAGRTTIDGWSVLAQAWGWLTAWWGPGIAGGERVGAAGAGEEGSWIDPDGAEVQGSETGTPDPAANGAEGDAGSIVDPNG